MADHHAVTIGSMNIVADDAGYGRIRTGTRTAASAIKVRVTIDESRPPVQVHLMILTDFRIIPEVARSAGYVCVYMAVCAEPEGCREYLPGPRDCHVSIEPVTAPVIVR